MHYLFLTFAIFLEITGTLLLPVSQNFTRLIPTIALCVSYGASFYFLTLALNALPIAVVYATWSGLGIFLITFFWIFYFQRGARLASYYWTLNDCRRGDITKYFCLT